MSEHIFNQWAHLPINLAAEQIANPLNVLDDFFSSSWLPEHIEELYKWRNSILETNFFVDAKGSPVSLLTAYKNNLKLIEASYLIVAAYRNGYDRYRLSIAENAEQLADEKQKWSHFPTLLNEVGLMNPLAVIEGFFNVFNLQEYREQLEEWLENGLSNQSADKWMESSKIISVYENLQKLYCAAWLIYQRLSDEPYLKQDKIITNVANIQGSSQQPVPSLYKLKTVITSDQHEQITQIVTIIKERAPSVQAIIYLGVPPIEQATMYLLVLTENNKQGLAQEISTHLEECCKTVANVFILAHYAASLVTATDEKNLFLKNAASCPLIYLSGGLILPKQKDTDHLLVAEVALRKWQRWQSQALEFLKGAEYYLSIGAHNAALFSLSQTAECLLVAIIRLVTLYEINTHNLERLLKLTQMFTEDISAIYELDDMEKKKLFNILKGAYVDVRYRDRYESDATAVAALYPLVKQMAILLAQLSQKHLLASTL